jgi:ABC-type uncharacterized transport system ATPase subunit
MPIITVNNRQVHIQELNKGAEQTVVLIHGCSVTCPFIILILPYSGKTFPCGDVRSEKSRYE